MLLFNKKRYLKKTLWNVLADDLYHHSDWSYIYFSDLFTDGKPFVDRKWLYETVKAFPDYCMRLYDVEIDNEVIRVKRNDESAVLDDIDVKRMKQWAKRLQKYYKKNCKAKEGGYKKLTVSDWPFKELGLLDSINIANFLHKNTCLVTIAHEDVVLVIGVK